MFEGDGHQARQYHKWYVVRERGLIVEKRGVEPCYAPAMRHGKTARDRASGAPTRRTANAEVRGAWAKATSGKGAKHAPFPIEVCNGRESRSLQRTHACNRPAIPGKKGGGPCRHKRQVGSGPITRKGSALPQGGLNKRG